jgi:hypothetical protein
MNTLSVSCSLSLRLVVAPPTHRPACPENVERAKEITKERQRKDKRKERLLSPLRQGRRGPVEAGRRDNERLGGRREGGRTEIVTQLQPQPRRPPVSSPLPSLSAAGTPTAGAPTVALRSERLP